MINNIINKAENSNWLSKKELMEICKCSKKSFERVIADFNCDNTVLIQTHIKKGGYHNSEVFYDGYLVKLIQTKLKKNAMNAGGQRTEGSIIKQDNQQDLFIGGNMKQIESGKVMTIKQIVNEIKEAGLVAPSERTIQRDVKKCFPDKKIENGKAITLTELEFTLLLDYMKHKNNRSDLASTTVVEHLTTNLSPALKMKQAFDLMNEAYQEEITRLKQQNIEVVEENGVLKLENKQLVEENNYLKKLNDFNTTQIEYYTKKYHSWYDDYENY